MEIATGLYKSKTGNNKRDCKKAEIEFWKKPEIQKEEEEIMSEIAFNKTKRERNWKISDLENILPNLYRKITAHNIV
ncbi:hypothetical protein [Lutibacter citreus]|uniref:hypothetical protein n=1 Tax=Lutibacter citreus TaxID=2138210 RepID=UPI00130068FF|nr:hypothetical protein [Lutibacter citreus]